MQRLNIFGPQNSLTASVSQRDMNKIQDQTPQWYGAMILAQLSALATLGGNLVEVPVQFTSDTAIHASGDILANPTAVPGVAAQAGAAAKLVQITLIDKDDQAAAAMDVVLFRSNVAFGALNAAPTISDLDSVEIIGIVPLLAADFIDLGGAKVATKILTTPLQVKPAGVGTSIYVALITRGTPTQTAAGLVGKFFFRQG